MASIPMFAIMALESNSTKALLALVVGALTCGVYFFIFQLQSKNRLIGVLTIVILTMTGLLLSAIYFDPAFRQGTAFFAEADPGQARAIIYSDALRHGISSFLVGYGPGPQVSYRGAYWDAHMTFLTVFLQSGLIGLTLFCIFLVKFARIASASPALLACFFAICIYALGGDILRRLPIWMVLFGVLVLAMNGKERIEAGRKLG